MAYERVTGPLGPERFDQLFGQLSYYVAASSGAKKLKAEKFVPKWDNPPATAESMEDVVRALTLQYGGDIVESSTS